MSDIPAGQTYDLDNSEPNGEKEWVKALIPRLSKELHAVSTETVAVKIKDGHKLPYTCEIAGYKPDGSAREPRSAKYETDLLVYDERTDGSGWIPRVVIECKIKGITTHDALTYSTKAATHKHVHPYIRYGILIGRFPGPVPARLIRHGAYFDFMAVSSGEEPSAEYVRDLAKVIAQEVCASRSLQSVLSKQEKHAFCLVHRPLVLVCKEPGGSQSGQAEDQDPHPGLSGIPVHGRFGDHDLSFMSEVESQENEDGSESGREPG